MVPVERGDGGGQLDAVHLADRLAVLQADGQGEVRPVLLGQVGEARQDPPARGGGETGAGARVEGAPGRGDRPVDLPLAGVRDDGRLTAVARGQGAEGRARAVRARGAVAGGRHPSVRPAQPGVVAGVTVRHGHLSRRTRLFRLFRGQAPAWCLGSNDSHEGPSGKGLTAWSGAAYFVWPQTNWRL